MKTSLYPSELCGACATVEDGMCEECYLQHCRAHILELAHQLQEFRHEISIGDPDIDLHTIVYSTDDDGLRRQFKEIRTRLASLDLQFGDLIQKIGDVFGVDKVHSPEEVFA